MEHTEQCEEDRVRIEKVREEYVKQWPNYCRRCNGWGGFGSTYDPSPAGVSLGSGSMEDFDPCPDCGEKNLCSRCGWGVDFSNAIETCPHCGAKFMGAIGIPRHECYCYEIEAQNMIDKAEDAFERMKL